MCLLRKVVGVLTCCVLFIVVYLEGCVFVNYIVVFVCGVNLDAVVWYLVCFIEVTCLTLNCLFGLLIVS